MHNRLLFSILSNPLPQGSSFVSNLFNSIEKALDWDKSLQYRLAPPIPCEVKEDNVLLAPPVLWAASFVQRETPCHNPKQFAKEECLPTCNVRWVFSPKHELHSYLPASPLGMLQKYFCLPKNSYQYFNLRLFSSILSASFYNGFGPKKRFSTTKSSAFALFSTSLGLQFYERSGQRIKIKYTC